MAEWVQTIKSRGWSPTMLMILDMIEPIAPFVAQSLYGVQPFARWWGGTSTLTDLAQCLESAEGIGQLRQLLADND